MAAGVKLGDIVPCETEVKLGKMAPFEFNPRGNLWYNDDNTFGHKLLSRMGWSKGKGLGKHEDGIKENIKIGKKDNLTGVGWKPDVHISVGCAEYENILKKLQHRFKKKTTEDKKPDKSKNLESLEKRSQSSRSRLHYQKYVRAKDFFTRSEKDLKCIFLDNPKDTEEEKEKEMHTHTSDLSVGDYFAKKMKEKLGKMVSNSKEPNIKPEIKTVEILETSKKVRKECTEFEETRNSAEEKLVIKSEKEFSNKQGFSKNRKNALDNFSESVNVKEVEAKIKFEEEWNNWHGLNKKQNTSVESLNDDINSCKNKLKAKFEKDFVAKQVSKRKRKGSPDSSVEHLEEIKIKSEKEVRNGKKLSKKRKNSSEDIVQLKKIKLENEDFSSGDLYSSVIEKSSVQETPDVEVRPKSKKSKKKRSHKLGGLKSCIKRSMSYNLNGDRKVFFNEQVSYKILDTSFESFTPINDLAVEEQNLFEESVQEESVQEESVQEESVPEESVQNTEFINAEGFMTNIRQFDEISSDSSDDECTTSIKHDKTPVLDSRNAVTNIKESINIPVTDLNDQEYRKNKKRKFKISSSKWLTNESEDSPPECFNLPKPASSDLNMWLESQRAATKMTVYKNMVKSIRKDHVLRTTNLLDIKGYGNWEL